jgi:phosphotriesterase-related protein
MVHSHPVSRTGLASMRILVEEGIDPAKVQIAHTGDTDDLDYIEELLQTGCTIGLDRYGLDLFLPHDRRQATMVALVERGHADRIVLGQDFVPYIDWYPPEVKPVLAPTWSMTFIFETAIPELLDRGVTRRQIDAMLGANVHRWLSA